MKFLPRRHRALLIVATLVIGLAALVGLALRSTLVRTSLMARLLPARQAVAGQQWTCPMHPDVVQDHPGTCPKCGMALEPVASLDTPVEPAHQGEGGRVDTPAAPAAEPGGGEPRAALTIDTRRQQLAGVRTVAVERVQLGKTIRTVGLVRYDETRLVDVNLKLEGWISELYVDYTGQFVRKGEPLFTLYSPELLATQNEYLLALKTRDQVRTSQIADAREYADRIADTARERLALWDLPQDQIDGLEKTRQAQPTLTFRSPTTGYVIEKQALKGMHAMAGQSLYKVADLSAVWVEADFYELDIPLVHRGQSAVVSLDAYPDQQFTGRVIYIYPYMEEQTRTVKVRFAFANRGGRLKPGMYANVQLDTDKTGGLAIPTDALLDSGTTQTVFVTKGDGYFEPRQVKAGQRLENKVQILDGLQEGEMVATGATFFLDSESQLRAALQGFEAPHPPPTVGRAAGSGLQVSLTSNPSPPKSGTTVFVVTVRDQAGAPVTDADVSLVLYMPPMPSMNMPAMKSDGKLPHRGNGVYEGPVEVLMPGRWDVSVSVARGGQQVAAKPFTVVAR